jgi:hypothetical protein
VSNFPFSPSLVPIRTIGVRVWLFGAIRVSTIRVSVTFSTRKHKIYALALGSDTNVRFNRSTRVASVKVGAVVCEYCERKREIERVTFSLRGGT